MKRFCTFFTLGEDGHRPARVADIFPVKLG
jgi:hypothetical protein